MYSSFKNVLIDIDTLLIDKITPVFQKTAVVTTKCLSTCEDCDETKQIVSDPKVLFISGGHMSYLNSDLEILLFQEVIRLI